jgi:hypothetical protein
MADGGDLSRAELKAFEVEIGIVKHSKDTYRIKSMRDESATAAHTQTTRVRVSIRRTIAPAK